VPPTLLQKTLPSSVFGDLTWVHYGLLAATCWQLIFNAHQGALTLLLGELLAPVFLEQRLPFLWKA